MRRWSVVCLRARFNGERGLVLGVVCNIAGYRDFERFQIRHRNGRAVRGTVRGTVRGANLVCIG